MSIITERNNLKPIDNICNYIPVVSTITNIAALFFKCVILPSLSQSTIKNSHFYSHLQAKDFGRCLLLLVPILGNIIVAILQGRTSAELLKAPEPLKPQIWGKIDPNNLSNILTFAGNPSFDKLQKLEDPKDKEKLRYKEKIIYREIFESYKKDPNIARYIPNTAPKEPTHEQSAQLVKQISCSVKSKARDLGLIDSTHVSLSLSRMAQDIENINLIRFFNEISLQILEPVIKPSKLGNITERAAEIRTWMNEHQDILNEIRSLYLTNFNLTTLPPEIGKLINLRELSLSGNKLTFLPPEIGRLVNLESLYLSWNKLASFPPEIGGLRRLERLHLDLNKLTSLPPEIGLLINLESLDLRWNKLTSLWPEIARLVNLEELKTWGNPLTYHSLPPEIDRLVNLRRDPL